MDEIIKFVDDIEKCVNSLDEGHIRWPMTTSTHHYCFELNAVRRHFAVMRHLATNAIRDDDRRLNVYFAQATYHLFVPVFASIKERWGHMGILLMDENATYETAQFISHAISDDFPEFAFTTLHFYWLYAHHYKEPLQLNEQYFNEGLYMTFPCVEKW